MCFHGGRSSLYSSYQIFTRRRRATAAAADHRIGHQFTLSDGGVLPSACHPHSPSLLNNQHLLLFVGLGASSCVCIRGGLSQISQFKFWFGRWQCNIIIHGSGASLGVSLGGGLYLILVEYFKVQERRVPVIIISLNNQYIYLARRMSLVS